jgi:hypothetical protein
MMMARRHHASADEHLAQRGYQSGEGQRTLGLGGIDNSHLVFLRKMSWQLGETTGAFTDETLDWPPLICFWIGRVGGSD